ncbi:MAG: outer membrane protein assembly factor BamD [Prevotellaceae bacterium]|jgi:outer membrane protein assembly factor BamD|nr:outer membrane protein assembly factor BamD [Prevotellaceae bacterium]
MYRLKDKGILLILISFVISGCAGYNKLLKNPDPEKRYSAGLEYYNNKKYSKSTPLFESLNAIYNGQSRDDTVNFYVAKGYYLMSDYFSAETSLEKFTRVFGRSNFAEEAYYIRAVNLYRLSSRSSLDQRNTIDAITAFNVFNTKFPGSEYVKDGDKDYLGELKGRLEEKAYMSAKLYFQIEDYKSAIVALRNSIRDFPLSKYNEEQSFLMLKASYIYAKKSVRKMQPERYIATIDEYYNFVSEYPDSKYKAEAETMYNESLVFTQKRGIDLDNELSIKK